MFHRCHKSFTYLARKLHRYENRAMSTSLSSSLVDFSHDPVTKIGTITLASPVKMNPLTLEMGAEFKSIIHEINHQLSKKELNVNALILKGSNGNFSAGGDLKWLKSLRKNPVHINADVMMHFYKSFLCVRDLPVPVVAAIEGYAVGAGACLTMACDIRVMDKKAKIAFNFAKLGIHAGMGGSHFLPIIVGQGKAAEILLTGKMISGEDAKDWGIVQKLVDSTDEEKSVYKEATNIATEIGRMHPLATRTMLQTLRLHIDTGLDAALRREAYAQALCYARDDWGEGLDAIQEKRNPFFDDYHD